MGLDWVLKSKVIEGKEDAHAEARKQRLEVRDAFYEQRALEADKLVLAELEEKLARLEDVENDLEISPYAVLGCPRVGIDDDATKYVVDMYNDPDGHRVRDVYPTLEIALAKMHGKYIAELAKNTEGIGRITGMLTGPESFRGKIVAYARDIIGDNLADRAYQDMDPDDMEDYADALAEAVESWRNDNEEKINLYMDLIGRLETDHSADPDVGQAIDTCHDIGHAVTWLRFWAKHEFSMHAWY